MRVILIIEIEYLRILYFVNVKSPQITNSRKSKHAKITRSTIYMVNLPSAEYTRLPNTHVSRLPSASASAEYTKPLSGADTIAALHGIGEAMALKLARKGQFSLCAIIVI